MDIVTISCRPTGHKVVSVYTSSKLLFQRSRLNYRAQPLVTGLLVSSPIFSLAWETRGGEGSIV